MRPNRFKQILAEGRIPVGHMIIEFGTRGMARMLDAAGVDFVLIDAEHASFTIGELADLVAWFKATTIAPFVRVPQIEYHLIARALDAGALGVMVPNVKDADQAAAIVGAVKYPPHGRRGLITGVANTDFRPIDAAEYMAWANDATTVICQIESEEGLANLEQVAATPGVDVLWVGHGDLSKSMGIPGRFHDPKLLDALSRVVETAREHGLGAGMQPGSLDQAEEWMAIGFNVISYGADARVYLRALSEGVAGVRRLAQ